MYRRLVAILPLLLPLTLFAATPRQLTSGPYNHALDNNDNFSPDDRYLAYDTRDVKGSIGEGRTIEKIEIESGEITILYRAPNPVSGQGPGVGAVSYHPFADQLIFIHGPLTSTGFTYDQAHRFGILISGKGNGKGFNADARDVTAPYTPGALRGGTHRHEFDGSGRWIGFTYNDSIMKARGRKYDLRSIGVTKLWHPVHVDAGIGNADGLGFSALVVQVVPEPKPGSDEISRADGDSWVGLYGYLKPDGTRQLARAFTGSTRDSKGHLLKDIYIVDIPKDITKPGPLGPLEGTADAFPAPCLGASQRRLTNTENRPRPGCDGVVRSHPDGSLLAFRASDDDGNSQIFLISPNGGEMKQLSNVPGGVQEGPRWLPSGNAVITVDSEGRLIVVSTVQGASFGKHKVIVDDGGPAPYAFAISHNGKMIAFNRDLPTNGTDYRQIFVVDYDEGPDGLPRN